MNNAKQVVKYLEALARELAGLGVREQYHILVSGGAWMLLAATSRRSTQDIDFALVVPPGRVRQNQVIGVTVQRGGEIASRSNKAPTLFAQAVEAVAADYGLPIDWCNDECAEYLYDSAPAADAYLWQVFNGVLFVYLATDEYVFALKLIASRRQDRGDLRVLLQRLQIQTPEEAQAILDKFISAREQQFWQAQKKVKRLFR